MSNIIDEEQKLVKKVVNKKRLKKLNLLSGYVAGLKGIVDYPTLDKQRKPLVKGISIPSKSKIESQRYFLRLEKPDDLSNQTILNKIW